MISTIEGPSTFSESLRGYLSEEDRPRRESSPESPTVQKHRHPSVGCLDSYPHSFQDLQPSATGPDWTLKLNHITERGRQKGDRVVCSSPPYLQKWTLLRKWTIIRALIAEVTGKARERTIA